MREFIYFSSKATTTGNFSDLKKAGRMDIVCHSIIMGFFVSNAIRKDVKIHLIFYGQPDPPKHLEITINEKNKEFFSKKDIAGLIKRMLYKYKKDEKTEVIPGCFIEKKSFAKVADELTKQGKTIFILDRKGENIRKTKMPKNSVFIVGDQEGIPKKERKHFEKISLGTVTYFASQSIAILQNELDLREHKI